MKKEGKPLQEMKVGQLLSQVCRMTGHHLRGHMERIGLHRGQGFAMLHIWHKNGMPQRDLARCMHISPASVTNMLQRMERDGWIERKRDESDQRLVRVFASDKAMEMRVEATKVFREIEDELNSVYTPEEQATLRQLLMKLHDRFAAHAPHDHHAHDFLLEDGPKPADTKNRQATSTDTAISDDVSADTSKPEKVSE